jgi:hypothetical protein
LLVEYFVGHFAKESGKSVRHIGKQTLGQLQAYRANLKKHPPKIAIIAYATCMVEKVKNGNLAAVLLGVVRQLWDILANVVVQF